MTGQVTGTPRGMAPGRRLRVLGLCVVAVVAVAAALWFVGRLPGAPMREGPLEGTTFEELRAPTEPGYAGILWGALLLHNPTTEDIVVDDVTLAGNPQGVRPLAAPYIWDEDRVRLLGFGAVSGHQLPLPSTWKTPPRHPVAGFTIRPHAEDASVEVLYELPVPGKVATVHGITVRYHTAGVAYRKTFDVSITICAPADPQPCQRMQE